MLIEECLEVCSESYYMKVYNILLQKSKLLEAQVTDTSDLHSNFLLYYNISIKFKVIENLNTTERIVGYYLTEYGDSSTAYPYWCKLLLRLEYYSWVALNSKSINLIESVTYVLRNLYLRRYGRCLK